MEKANFDTTYCMNDKCDKKCFRHHSHYEFEDDKNYCCQSFCTNFALSSSKDIERYY